MITTRDDLREALTIDKCATAPLNQSLETVKQESSFSILPNFYPGHLYFLTGVAPGMLNAPLFAIPEEMEENEIVFRRFTV